MLGMAFKVLLVIKIKLRLWQEHKDHLQLQVEPVSFRTLARTLVEVTMAPLEKVVSCLATQSLMVTYSQVNSNNL